MVELLTKYFLANREVVLPGIGQLQSFQAPARFDAARQMMLPPTESFQWKPDGEAIISAQGLMGFLSRQKQWSEEESYEQVMAFCQMVKKELADAGQWVWPGLGKLISISEGKIGFVPHAGLDHYSKAIPAVRVQHANRPLNIKSGDQETNLNAIQEELAADEWATNNSRWWIPALIMGILTLVLISLRLLAIL